MRDFKLKIVPAKLLPQFLAEVGEGLGAAFEDLKDAAISTETFSFYTSVSAIASSRIEGEQMEVDSYVKHKMLNIQYQPDLVQKPNDLYKAYQFAQGNELSKANFLKAHAILAAHLLPKNRQGALRTVNMLVMEHKTARVQFEAALFHEVKPLFDLLWKDIEQLKKEELSVEEVFYFASLIHIVFVNIHPFEDGNGRAARLLEKWFVAEKLSKKAWFMQTELNYYTHANDYYRNLNRLGMFYDQLDYGLAMPFLLMSATSLLNPK